MEERKEERVTGKIGVLTTGIGSTSAQRAEETAYRQAFSNLILQQASAIGFKPGPVSKDISLVNDKKLALRVIGFLVGKVFGPPPSNAPVDGKPTPIRKTMTREEETVEARPTKPAAQAAVTDPSSSARRGVVASSSAPAAPSATRRPRPKSPVRDEEEAAALEDDAASYTEDAEEEQEEDEPMQRSSASVYDGRFAEEEFNDWQQRQHEQPQQPHRKPPARRPAAASKPQCVSTRSKPSGIPDDQKTKEELKNELLSERVAHEVTAAQLANYKTLYENLIRDETESKFATRRTMLIKAQSLQLERQLTMLAETTDTKREALAELGTIVSGLENAAASDSSDPSKAHRKLGALSSALEAAKARLDRLHRSELSFSSSEEKFLRSDAPLAPESIYSGLLTHLNLNHVHALENKLAQLHEQLLSAHAMLASVGAKVDPVDSEITRFLQRERKGESGETLRLQTLVDSIRSAAFELQSLGVLLPSATGFRSDSSSSSVDGQHHHHEWIHSVRELLRRKNVPAQQIDNLLSRVETQEQLCAVRAQILDAELAFQRRTQGAQNAAVARLLNSVQALVAKFNVHTNESYASASRALEECVVDWQRNSSATNIQRLLAVLQSIFPVVRQLLTSSSSAAFGASIGIGMAPIAAEFESEVARELTEFRARAAELHGRIETLEAGLVPSSSVEFAEQREEKRRAAPQKPSKARKSPPEELPPFQF
jgi:hypothetical protein